MQKRRLGRTNLEVSVIGFGGIPIVKVCKEEACEMIRRAFDLGISYFDTARAYGDGEEKLGTALEDIRDKIIIATKTHQRTREDAARAGLKQSLRKLRTNRIDIVFLHGIDDEKTLKQAMKTEGSLTALKEARTQGKINFIGISGHRPYILANAIKTGEFDVILVPLNLINREATEELLPLAKELDIGIVVMKPFGGTDYRFVRQEWWGTYVPDKTEFNQIFGEGMLKTERALKFALAHTISTVIPGFSSTEEIETAAKVGREFVGLTSREVKDTRFGELPPSPLCRLCGLCMPCPEGLNIPLILTLQTYHTFHGIKDWTRQVYDKLSTKFDSCTKCAECEPKCPYKLPIIEMLFQTEKTLKT
jgi:predicted aldo/keto reductase-like oxidoreductase